MLRKYLAVSVMHSFRLLLIILFLFISVNLLKAGTLLLMGIGLPTSGGAGSACTAAQFDFSDSCNTIFFTGVMTP